MYFVLYACFSIKSFLANLEIGCFCVCLRQISGRCYLHDLYENIR